MDAQVYSTFFHQKNAFETYPALKSITTEIPVKQMAEVNVKKYLPKTESWQDWMCHSASDTDLT
jgi:hypothetical protein